MNQAVRVLAFALVAAPSAPPLRGQQPPARIDTTRADTTRTEKALGIDTILDQLRTPASPVFVLLGVAPSAIERPTTPKAVAASIISSSGLQSLPKNYSIEITPYWLSPHPGLTWARFQHPGMGASLVQNLSLSLATSSSSPLLPDSGTAVGFAVRTFVSTGYADTTLVKELTDTRNRLGEVQRQQNIVRLHLERNAGDTAKLRAERDSLASLNEHDTRQLQALVKERTGLVVEAAAGLVAAYPRDAFEKGKVARLGVWVTPTYRIPRPQVDLLLVTRFIRDVGASHTLFDVGGRLVYGNRGLSVSTEYVGRFGTARADRTHRASGNLEYRWAEGKYVTATFGRDFTAPGAKTLIALIGVNLGFGPVPVLSLKR